jgi:hypothetical protein
MSAHWDRPEVSAALSDANGPETDTNQHCLQAGSQVLEGRTVHRSWQERQTIGRGFEPR